SKYAVEAIKYAADMGAVICNNSYFVDAKSRKIFQEAINYFVEYAGCDENGNKREDSPMKGGIVIASAGNDNACPDVYVPGSLDNVISVASINPRFEKSSFSNYAPWVTVSAFGGGGDETPAGQDWGIWSTMNNYSFAPKSGTSMAAPVVSGVAALLVSYLSQDNPNLTAEEVKYRLLQNTLPVDEYNPQYKGMLGCGWVHAYAALTGEMNWPPTIIPVAGTPDVEKEQPVYYGEDINYVFDVADKESEVTYTVEDPTGAFTHEMKDGKLTFSLVNRGCQAGSYTISFTVTDKGLGDEGRKVQATTRAFSVRLLPEVRTEVGVENDNKTLTVRASTTFSGTVTVSIYDANGNLAQKQEIETSLSAPGALDISGLDGGTYTVKLTCNNKTITKNIIKL
ncbi:MAG: S8 family peptidase, partial [Odoribacter sp.]|nr:S8 family peptidase [Odoribacter sp.]